MQEELLAIPPGQLDRRAPAPLVPQPAPIGLAEARPSYTVLHRRPEPFRLFPVDSYANRPMPPPVQITELHVTPRAPPPSLPLLITYPPPPPVE